MGGETDRRRPDEAAATDRGSTDVAYDRHRHNAWRWSARCGPRRGGRCEIVGGDAGAGAAAGAVAARSQSRRQHATKQQQAAQQQQQAQGAQQASYAKARTACLEGRGYSVK